MQKLGLNELREKFLSFFESKGHLRLPSFSLIPENDPSLLLINAGMAPLKRYFTGELTPKSNRITTCQKCVRTLDIENVGKTSRHGTFFEMLGNFSFGDYFKKEAIQWAWEFCVEVLVLPVDKIWISVYKEDDEAYEIWTKDIGVSPERMVRLGKEDNFWEHGVGPCGPCSEIYFDRGEEAGCKDENCAPGCDCDRFVEIWNNVFTQFDRQENGDYIPLSKPNIDTGMGLERLACMMQGVNSIFEVDTIRKILDKVCAIAAVEYGKEYDTDLSLRVVTDHIRSAAMLISDGVTPSNEGRGYVLRRLIRRACRHGRLLGIKRVFLNELCETVIDQYGEAYPQLEEKKDYIRLILKNEEENFNITIDKGMVILNDILSEVENRITKVVEGKDVFRLHDTFGFPIDLTKEIAFEKGFSIDEKGFALNMQEQKEKARKALKDKGGTAWGSNLFARLHVQPTVFTGYQELTTNAKLLFMIKNDETIEQANENDEVLILLDKSPFYAESGGQTGDSGTITCKTGKIRVEDTFKTPDGIWIHACSVIEGIVLAGSDVLGEVDAEKRESVARNHTATHLIQKALKNVLGNHIQQAGSYVDSEKLRFDFSHFSALSHKELCMVEDEVNKIVLSALPVSTKEMSLDDAKKMGATALFGEKYQDTVRVVDIGGYSMELCGGTHIQNTSIISLIKIVSESGVASGTRRIEAITADKARKYYKQTESTLNAVGEILKSKGLDIEKKAMGLVHMLKDKDREIASIMSRVMASKVDEMISSAVAVNGINIVSAEFVNVDMTTLRDIGDKIKGNVNDCVVLLIASLGEKVNIIAMASNTAVKKGVHCGNAVKEIAQICGGGGGGRPDMAQAGGSDISKIKEALKAGIERMKNQIKPD